MGIPQQTPVAMGEQAFACATLRLQWRPTAQGICGSQATASAAGQAPGDFTLDPSASATSAFQYVTPSHPQIRFCVCDCKPCGGFSAQTPAVHPGAKQ